MDKDQEKAAKAREAALKGALGQIERQFGQGSIMKMGDEAAAVRVQVIPTGALSLDLALGVGGVPRGRIVEVFGPESSGKTTLLYHVLASAQQMGGICAFIDAEHAMDPAYAKRIGVDIDELLVSQPDHGEQALEIADLLIRSGAVDVVAIDSVAALTPKAELEGQMGDQTVGVQARMMSQAMRKLAGNLNRANTLCIFTNQIREKVGVMFGCFHYDARVVLADGSTEKIGKIVNQRMPVEVMSMDTESGEISPKRVVEYYNNGETDEWLQFEVAAAGGSGVRKFACTPNHLIFTPEGERSAEEIEEGDEVLTAVKHYDLREDQLKLILGSLLGDGSLRFASDHNASFRVGHGDKQLEYCEWKHEMLAPFANSGDRTRQLHEKIAPYVHPTLEYKLHPDFRGRFGWYPDTSDAHLNGTRLKSRTRLEAVPMRVLRKYRKPPTPRKRDRFDLQIEGNHTYLVDHVVVHNSPETQPGGRALKFYSSQRLDIRRIETLKEGTEAIGNRVRVKVVKNKVAAPFRQAEFDIEYGQGISSEGCLLDLGLEHGIVEKSGSFFSHGEERLGQGRNNAKGYLREHPEVAGEIERRIYEAVGAEPATAPLAAVPADQAEPAEPPDPGVPQPKERAA
jgi:RecA/RadA recombinase